MTAATITISRIDDTGGDGECSSCGRGGIRWLITLSDGSAVGIECARKVLGFRPAPKTYDWIADFTAVAEHAVTYPNGEVDTYVMWQHKTGRETRETCNGILVTVGGVRTDWTKKGWL
jgi:hypothetical protein